MRRAAATGFFPMIVKLLTKVFGSRNDRLLRQYGRVVESINTLEPATAALSDEQLRAKTAEFRKRHADGVTLDETAAPGNNYDKAEFRLWYPNEAGPL